jgi:multidrug transporter EmrE-like cation transporter
MNPWMFVVIWCAVMGASAQILFKQALEPLQLIKLLVGFMLYGVAFVLYLASLRHLEVSVAYPLLGISYILVAIGSYLWLGESWSISKSIGTIGLLICVWLIAR